MKTLLLNSENIKEAKKVLKEEGVLAFPTETVYGLGVICSSENAFKHLVDVKNRPATKPFTLMCSSIDQVNKYAEIDERTLKVINKFMPGEITILVTPKNKIEPWINLGTDKIGIRIPNNKFALELINAVGTPLLVPSANPSDYPPALDSNEVLKYFDNKIEAVIIGESGHQKPSTIIDLTSKEIKIIREGNISLKEIMEAIGE